MTQEDVEKYFVYSMMTVYDEHCANRYKYGYLVQIEWIEMFCRLA